MRAEVHENRGPSAPVSPLLKDLDSTGAKRLRTHPRFIDALSAGRLAKATIIHSIATGTDFNSAIRVHLAGITYTVLPAFAPLGAPEEAGSVRKLECQTAAEPLYTHSPPALGTIQSNIVLPPYYLDSGTLN